MTNRLRVVASRRSAADQTSGEDGLCKSGRVRSRTFKFGTKHGLGSNDCPPRRIGTVVASASLSAATTRAAVILTMLIVYDISASATSGWHLASSYLVSLSEWLFVT
jgi:hypothetical protein